MSFGSILGGVARVATGFVAGGPIGALTAAATLPSFSASKPSSTGARMGSVGGGVAGIAGQVAGSYLAGKLSGGSSCGCSSSSGRDPCTQQKYGGHVKAPEASFFGGCCPPGRVLRRRPWARDICARKARMNVANPRALRRAIRRARGFEKLAMSVLGFTRPHKPKGRPYFKKSRRR